MQSTDASRVGALDGTPVVGELELGDAVGVALVGLMVGESVGNIVGDLDGLEVGGKVASLQVC